MTNKKKILFICSDDFPRYGANGKLLLNLCRAGLAEENDIHVLTYKHNEFQSDEEIFENIVIHRFFSWFMFPKEHIKSLLRQSENSLLFEFLVKKAIPKVLTRINGSFFLSKQYSDDILQTIIELDRKNQFDVIVPIMAGFENVDAAIRFKEKFLQKKVVVYQMDPCGDNMMEKTGSHKARLALEDKFLKAADAVITTPIIYKRFKEIYPSKYMNKVYTMEFPAVVKKEVIPHCTNEKIICLFTGNIYHKIRDPRYTLRLFKEFENTNVELHLLGKCDERIEEYLIGKNTFFHKSVSSEAVAEYVSSANILVNIGNSMVNQVPSKLFEYISTGKPIVNIYKNCECPSLKYLDKYQLSCSLLENDKDFAENKKKLWKFLMDTYLKSEDLSTVYVNYVECTPKWCCKYMNDIITKL